jgi:iron complex outermembrane receptor protein
MLSQNYSSGYKDQLPDGGKAHAAAGFNPDVSSYTTYGLSATYTGIKNTYDHDRHPEPVRPRSAVHRAQRGRSRWRRLGSRVADPRGRSLSILTQVQVLL